MTLFKIKLEDCGYFCIDLDTISSFYIGVGNKLKILPIGGSDYINECVESGLPIEMPSHRGEE